MGAADLFTLDDLATEVSRGHGSPDAVTKEKAKKWINRALIEISAIGPWSFLRGFDDTITTNSSSNEYALDARIKKIRSMFMRSPQRKLFFLDTRTFRTIIPDETQSSSSPTHYSLKGYDPYTRGLLVYFYPKPDAAYTVRIDADIYIPLLEQDTDDIREVSMVPEYLVPSVIDLSTAISFREIDDSQYLQAKSEAMAKIEKLFYDDQNEIDEDLKFKVIGFDDFQRRRDPILPPEFGD